MKNEFRERVYSGVLGKIMGVYLGRPVEGWSYEKIINTFDTVEDYVSKKMGIPLIVADDDISGTFGFFRAMEDFGYRKDIGAKEIGREWLNSIIEDKTILWWGGLGRSTEHTAWLNLKNGIDAPMSGSEKLNGSTLANQIGAQIFMDAFAMMCPGDPEKAAYYVGEAASVSHDGLAVDAAKYLGAMEAEAFVERDINRLLDDNFHYVKNEKLRKMIGDVREICSRHTYDSWREARAEIAVNYGYDSWPGCCHMIPNHALVIASALLGGDDFFKSISIASSAAWDTDCNAGNVGCLNGIRLGLDGVDFPSFLRKDVADRLLVVTSDGGACVSDAVREAEKIIYASDMIYGNEPEEKGPRFSFKWKGATQGFTYCPYVKKGVFTEHKDQDAIGIRNYGKNGLLLRAEKNGLSVSTPTSIDYAELASNFSTIASPMLYEGQEPVIKLTSDAECEMETYILYYDEEQKVEYLPFAKFSVKKGENELRTIVPRIGGMPIFRFGFTLKGSDNLVTIKSIDWKGSPVRFAQEGMLMRSIWETRPYWFRSWVGSIKEFAADFNHTYCASNATDYGVMTLGTDDWDDYEIESDLFFYLHKRGGLVLRSKGTGSYVSVLLSGNDTLTISETVNGEESVLATAECAYPNEKFINVKALVKGDKVTAFIDGKEIASARVTRKNGGAGFRIDSGTFTAMNFSVERR